MAGVVVEMSGDEAKLWRSFQKIVAQQQSMEDGFSKVTRSGKGTEEGANRIGTAFGQAGKKFSDNFGPGAIRQLASYAAGFTSITSAISLVTSALTDMAETRRAAMESFASAEMGLAGLAQVSESGEQYREFVGAAKKAYAAGGAANLDEAGRLIFSLVSAGAMEEADFFTQMRSTGLVEQPAVMARSAATIQTSMGKAETGTMRDIVSKAFAASIYSPSSAEAILEAASRGGTTASALGMRDEELLAATALMATATGNAERGGTQVASLLRTLDEQGEFKGLGLPASVRKISAMGLEGEEAFKYFGRLESMNAFRVLESQLPLLEKVIGEVEKGQATDAAGRKLRLAETEPVLKAMREKRIAEANKELSGESLAISSAKADVMVAQKQAEFLGDETAWAPEWNAWASRSGAGTARWMLGDEGFTKAVEANKKFNELFYAPWNAPKAMQEWLEGMGRPSAPSPPPAPPPGLAPPAPPAPAPPAGFSEEEKRALREAGEKFKEAGDKIAAAVDRIGGTTDLGRPDEE